MGESTNTAWVTNRDFTSFHNPWHAVPYSWVYGSGVQTSQPCHVPHVMRTAGEWSTTRTYALLKVQLQHPASRLLQPWMCQKDKKIKRVPQTRRESGGLASMFSAASAGRQAGTNIKDTA